MRTPVFPYSIKDMQVDVGQQRGDYSPNAKGNFQFERMIVGWRTQRALDLRRK
jgi:hypothetical protein